MRPDAIPPFFSQNTELRSQSSRSSRDISFFSLLTGFDGGLGSAACRQMRGHQRLVSGSGLRVNLLFGIHSGALEHLFFLFDLDL